MPGISRFALRQYLEFILPCELDTRQKVTVIYRYISWLATSLYYLAVPPYNTLLYKIAVVIALFIFSCSMMDSYIKSNSVKAIRTTALIETVGLTLLLIPTGGLDSPFIWYALNPVFIASNYIEGFFCWGNLLFYLLTSLLISFKLFNINEMTIKEFIYAKFYIILVYFLVTLAMRLVSSIVKQLTAQAQKLHQQQLELIDMNAMLNEANKKVNKSMEYVMSLYHIIEVFSSRKEPQALFKQMTYGITKVAGCESAFIYIATTKETARCLTTHGLTEVQEEFIANYFDSLEAIKFRERESFHMISEQGYQIIQIRSASKMYGYMGIGAKAEESYDSYTMNCQLYILLADLIAQVIERKHLEQLAAKLTILEEQNRIGNEIHDGVSQRLFSIICGIHTLKINWRNLDAEASSRQLMLLEESMKEASIELRTSIYRLSSSKRGEVVFKEGLENYLTNLGKLNEIKVTFEFNGDERHMSTALKQAVYRIVSEATGNAVRHGECSALKVQLLIKASRLDLLIKDNGKGFDMDLVLRDKDQQGLGLNNMQLLTESFGGEFEIKSAKDIGTEIQIRIPLSRITEIQERSQGGVA